MKPYRILAFIVAFFLAFVLSTGVVEIVSANNANVLPMQQYREVPYVMGGIGLEERNYLQSIKQRFTLQLEIAQKNGAYISDADVRIRDTNGYLLFETRMDGPILLAGLRSGVYVIEVTYKRQVRSKTYTLVEGKLKRVVLQWDGELGDRKRLKADVPSVPVVAQPVPRQTPIDSLPPNTGAVDDLFFFPAEKTVEQQQADKKAATKAAEAVRRQEDVRRQEQLKRQAEIDKQQLEATVRQQEALKSQEAATKRQVDAYQKDRIAVETTNQPKASSAKPIANSTEEDRPYWDSIELPDKKSKLIDTTKKAIPVEPVEMPAVTVPPAKGSNEAKPNSTLPKKEGTGKENNLEVIKI